MRTSASPERAAWTADAVRQLGMITDLETASAILGIGRTKASELARNSEFPVKILRIGRRYVVPVPALMALLEG
jgi:Helix-turn-helix domain